MTGGRRRWLGLAAFTVASAAVEDHRAVATALEHGGFDALLAPDHRAPGQPHLEPFTLLAALAPVTTRIGLVAGASPTLHEPFTVARKLASLDHLSGGRAGWLADPAVTPAAAAALGRDAGPPPGRAEEFGVVVRALWDSFADGAVVRDAAAGRYYDPAGLRPPHHEGAHFRVRGPLNLSRPPQGHPVVLRPAGGPPDDFPPADVLLTEAPDVATGARLVIALDDRMAAAGRDPDAVRVWQVLDVPAGSPVQAADVLERWFTAGAADGFVLRLPTPGAAADIAAGLVPELRRRGLARPAYPGPTLREHLRLARPEAA